ncbi:MAG: type II secretion system F family protein [Microlunatus sp.]|nr:type II secretion system F family protein [Microlunatus sp.]
MTLPIALVLAGLAPLVWPARLAPRVPAATSGPVRPRPDPEDVLSVATALELMALALGGGVPLVTAVEVVADRCGPVVAGQLRQVVAALRWGVEEARAWDGLPAVWRPAGQALALAGMAGVPPAGLLRRAASDMRRAEQRRIEEATGRLSVLVVIPLGLCFLPAFALLTVVPVIAALAGDLLAGAA